MSASSRLFMTLVSLKEASFSRRSGVDSSSKLNGFVPLSCMEPMDRAPLGGLAKPLVKPMLEVSSSKIFVSILRSRVSPSYWVWP